MYSTSLVSSLSSMGSFKRVQHGSCLCSSPPELTMHCKQAVSNVSHPGMFTCTKPCNSQSDVVQYYANAVLSCGKLHVPSQLQSTRHVKIAKWASLSVILTGCMDFCQISTNCVLMAASITCTICGDRAQLRMQTCQTCADSILIAAFITFALCCRTQWS